MIKHFSFLLLLISQNLVLAQPSIEQNLQIDSLKKIISSSSHDTNKIKAYITWDNIIYASDPNLDFEINNKIKLLCLKNLRSEKSKNQKIFYQTKLGSAYNNIGLVLENKSEYTSALQNHLKAIQLRKVVDDKKGIAGSYSNLGNIYSLLGNYPQAVSSHLNSLKIREQLNDKQGMATSFINLGSIYYFQKNYEEALKNYNACLKINIEICDTPRLADSYNNIGAVYYDQKNYALALKNQLMGLNIRIKLKDERGVASSYTNIGVIYEAQHNYEKALKSQIISLEIREKINDIGGKIASLINIASLKQKLNNPLQSKKHLLEALAISTSIGRKELTKSIYFGLADAENLLRNYKASFENYKLYIIYRDSLVNEENTKKTVQTQMQYEFDKTQTADSIKNAEHAKQETLKHNQEIQQQKMYTYGGIVLFGIMLIVAFISFRAFKNKQKANQIIAEQKQQVEEKQKEILDSIRYAKRIQMALLPSEKYINSKINTNFLRKK